MTCCRYDVIQLGAAAKAAAAAVQHERECWLLRLESWLKAEEAAGGHKYTLAVLDAKITRLRRALGIRVERTPDEIRAATRERVRLHRARKAGA